MLLLVESDALCMVSPSAPGVAAMSHDRKKPRALVAATEARVEPPCAQIRFLHHVLRIVLVVQEMARQRVRVINQRDDVVLEAIVKGLAQVGTGLKRPSI